MIESNQIVHAVHWIGGFRKRIITMIFAVLAFVVGVFYYTDKILYLLTAPLGGKALFFMTPIDGIMTKLKLALFTGIIISFPVTLFFLISIFGTLLDKKKKRKLYFYILPSSTILLAGGIFFGYKYIMPSTIGFLISAGEEIMEPMLSGNNYVSFASFLLMGVGLIFQLPLILISASRFGIVSYKWLAMKRKISFFLTFIFVAFVTPTPDAFTLLAVSAPVLFLYEISIWIIFLLEKLDISRAKKIEEKEVEEEEC